MIYILQLCKMECIVMCPCVSYYLYTRKKVALAGSIMKLKDCFHNECEKLTMDHSKLQFSKKITSCIDKHIIYFCCSP